MKISARNTIRGTVKNVVQGRSQRRGGAEGCAGIRNCRDDQCALGEGLKLEKRQKKAYAVIKATSVMVAIDWSGFVGRVLPALGSLRYSSFTGN